MKDSFFLIVSAVFPPEPVVSAKLSCDLATSIANHESVTVISPFPTRPYGFKFTGPDKPYRFKHYQLQSYTCPESNMIGRLKETYSFGKACYQFISEHHLEISAIYSNTWPLFAQYYTVKAAKKFNIPVIIHVQDIYPESLSNKLPLGKSIVNAILMPIDRYAARYASKIITISEKMRSYFAKTRKVDINKTFVVQNWQDEQDFIKYHQQAIAHSKSNEPFTFMYLGNIGPVAGIDVLIEGFACANLNNCRLVIAGSGSAKELLQQKAASLNRADIEFWPVPDGQVQQIQACADVMLLPMKKGASASSVPSKLPAYMLSKKPVLTCVDAGSDISDIVEQGNCGWVIAPENVMLLAEKMEQVAGLPADELKTMGNNGFNYAMQHFSKAENLKKLLNIVDSILPKKAI